MADILIDSYSEANTPSEVDLRSGYYPVAFAQTFTVSSPAYLKSCKFYLARVGSPPSGPVARLFNITGTYGTDSLPTGSALATSDYLDTSGLSTSPNLQTFTFPTPYLMNAGYYAIALGYQYGDSDNYIISYYKYNGSHSGNMSESAVNNFAGGNNAYSYYDLCFYVYGQPVATGNPLFFGNFY